MAYYSMCLLAVLGSQGIVVNIVQQPSFSVQWNTDLSGLNEIYHKVTVTFYILHVHTMPFLLVALTEAP